MTPGSRGDVMLVGRVMAGIQILEHTGIRDFRIEHQEVEEGDTTVRWWAEGHWTGTRVFTNFYPYPAQAVEELLAQVLNGGHCQRCDRTTIVGMEHVAFCSFTLHADDLDKPATYRYIRSCEREDAINEVLDAARDEP